MGVKRNCETFFKSVGLRVKKVAFSVNKKKYFIPWYKLILSVSMKISCEEVLRRMTNAMFHLIWLHDTFLITDGQIDIKIFCHSCQQVKINWVTQKICQEMPAQNRLHLQAWALYLEEMMQEGRINSVTISFVLIKYDHNCQHLLSMLQYYILHNPDSSWLTKSSTF